MLLTFDNSFLDEIRQKADIVQIISDYVKLELKGKNYLGLCPFHQEKTPSFTVSRDKQLYYCFGCGAGGDIFNFMMEMENLSFMEAAKILAERFGVQLPEDNISFGKGRNRKLDELREQLFEIHHLTTKYFAYLLSEHPKGQVAREYFAKRGFTRATIEKFRLGYAPQAWTALFSFLIKKGYSADLLEKAGLILPRNSRHQRSKNSGYYDRFRGRAMFTIFNLRGQPIAFGGRVLTADQQPKYLNSPESEIFVKNQNLYGLNFAREMIRQTRQAVIVEGYTDVITAHQYGVGNVVASLGTSLTENQARLLARYADQVSIAYDADAAGQKATLRGLDILKKAGLVVKVLKLPPGTDPDELLQKSGAEGFQELLQTSISLIDFKLSEVLKKYDLFAPEGKVRAVEELLPVVLSIDNQIEKDYLLNQIAKGVDISRQVVEQELALFIQEKSKNKDKSNKNWHTIEEIKVVPQAIFEAKFIAALLKKPQMLGQIFSEITPESFKNPDYRQIINQIHLVYQQLSRSEKFQLLETSEFIESFSEERLKKLVLELLFKYDDLAVTEEFIMEGLNQVKEYQKTMEMGTIRSEINQIKSQGSLNDLNQVLIRYQCLLHQNSRKGGC